MARRLLLLNGVAAIGAVVNHATGWGFTALIWWTDRYQSTAVPDFSKVGSAEYYALRAAEQLIMFTLPAFLFVSGFFMAFAAGRAATLGWDKISGRLRVLLVPYLLWSIAIFVGRSVEGSGDSAGGYARQLLFGGAAEPYYYIPLLTQMFILAPLIVGLVRRHWRAALAIAALLQLAAQASRYPVILRWDLPMATWIWQHTPGWFFPHMIFWFVFGIVAGFHLPALKAWAARHRAILPWVTLALGLAAFAEWELLMAASGRDWLRPTMTLLDSAYAGAFVLTFLAFAEAPLPGTGWLDSVGARSFGIYLVHAPVLEILSRMSYHVTPVLLGHQLLFLVLLVAAGVAVPLVLMGLVRRSPARPVFNYLFG
jgi:surface polysaccharide O-acyltransferase-like enzyme